MKRFKHINIVAPATILSISCGVLIGCNNNKEVIIVPTLKEMTVTGPSKIDLQQKGQLVVKEGETVLTSGLTFKSSDNHSATINELGEIDTFELGTITITVSKEGYKDAIFTFEIIEPEIPLKRMNLTVSSTRTRVGGIISFIAITGTVALKMLNLKLLKEKILLV